MPAECIPKVIEGCLPEHKGVPAECISKLIEGCLPEHKGVPAECIPKVIEGVPAKFIGGACQKTRGAC